MTLIETMIVLAIGVACAVLVWKFALDYARESSRLDDELRNVVTWSISGEWTPTIPAQWFINE